MDWVTGVGLAEALRVRAQELGDAVDLDAEQGRVRGVRGAVGPAHAVDVPGPRLLRRWRRSRK